MTATGLEPRSIWFVNEHSTIWPNWIYESNGFGFESSCSHLNFRFRACFEQGVPCNSGNYRARIHSENAYVTWQEHTVRKLLTKNVRDTVSWSWLFLLIEFLLLWCFIFSNLSSPEKGTLTTLGWFDTPFQAEHSRSNFYNFNFSSRF